MGLHTCPSTKLRKRKAHTTEEPALPGERRFRQLPDDPVFRLGHGSPDVGSALGWAGIAREIVVLEGTFDSRFLHATGERGNTEGNVRGRRAVVVLAGRAETFERKR